MSLVETSPHRSESMAVGHRGPVVLIPGLAEPDFFLQPAAAFLGRHGKKVSSSGIGFNLGRLRHEIDATERHLRDTVDSNAEPAVLVGHSIGGLYARVLAIRNPEYVRGVITVGSPSHENPSASIRPFNLVGNKIRVALDGIFRHFIDELQEPMSVGVPEHHIHSPLDVVINHTKHCTDPMSEHHRVLAPNHLTLMLNPLVLRKIDSILTM